jgi:hypothetical protein
MQSVHVSTNKMLNPAHGEVYLMQHYVMKVVGYMRQVSDFL